MTFPSVQSLSEVLVRLGREAFCAVMVGNGILTAWVQKCLLSLQLVVAASVPRNFQSSELVLPSGQRGVVAVYWVEL